MASQQQLHQRCSASDDKVILTKVSHIAESWQLFKHRHVLLGSMQPQPTAEWPVQLQGADF